MAVKNKSLYLAAMALFLGGLGWLIFSGLSENQVYFLNVGEALAMKPGQLNQARLFGTVSAENLRLANGGLGVSFSLVDKDDPHKVMTVDYTGAVPDTFKPGIEVIVEGAMDQSKGLFAAQTLMTKCPSKYQKQNRG
jgi:cytochrome c-type biogenesis protein CcmE